MDEFFDLTKRFVNIQGFEKVDKLFNLFIEEFKVVQLQPRFEYVRPTAFLTEIPIKADDNKKRSYQFNKVKSTPKWMNYAWDILG